MKQQEYFKKCQELLDYMENLQYSPATIINIKKMVNRIDRNVNRHSSMQHNVFRKTLVWRPDLHNFDIIHDYVFNGINPIPFKRERKWQRKSSEIVGEMRELIDFYISTATYKYRPNTIALRKLCLTKFFYFVQSRGVFHLSEITENDVFDFYQMKILSPATCKHFRAALTNVKAFRLADIQRLINLLPSFPITVRSKQVLSPQEMQKIHSTLMDENNCLSLRDRAIGLLAFYTGMRITDIANLRQDSIRWESQQIIMRQSKTSQWLTLELRPIVGNAIYRYIREERPKETGLNQIFLSKSFGVTPLIARNISNIGTKIYKLAGVRQNGERKGMHIFRHTLVNQLIDFDTDAAIISNLLGHQSPRSLENYLATNESKLSQFALDISCYPLN